MKSLTKNKKGIALNQAFGAVLVLVLVAILVIISLVLFVNLGDTFTNLETRTIVNETVSSVGHTPTFFAQTENQNLTLCNVGGYSAASLTAWNSSDDLLINAENYTVISNGSIITIAAIAPIGLNNSDWILDYSFNWGGPSCVASNDMIEQFGTYPTLIGLVGTIIFLGLVIGVLIASFVFGGRRRGGF